MRYRVTYLHEVITTIYVDAEDAGAADDAAAEALADLGPDLCGSCAGFSAAAGAVSHIDRRIEADTVAEGEVVLIDADGNAIESEDQ